MVNPNRRSLLRGAATMLVAGAGAGHALAADFPVAGKAIRIVVPFPPGGQTDLQARLVAPLLAEALGTSVVVENKPGGNMIIAAQDAVRAAPDGHTLLYANAGMFTRNPFLYNALPYDPLADFTPITQFVVARNVLTASASLPATDLAGLVQLARTRPQPLKYAIAGVGSNSHVLMELLKSGARIPLEAVPYKGSADATRDVMAGVVDLYVDGTQTALQNARAGRVRLLGITGASRLAAMPEVPTFVEQGYAAMNILGWIGFFGPAGMNAATTRQLQQALVRILERPEVAAAIVSGGNEPLGSTPEALRAALRAEHEQMAALFAQLGLPKQ